jgi:hypothetical protein
MSIFESAWEAGVANSLGILDVISRKQWDLLRLVSYDANRGWNEGALHAQIMRLESSGE